MIFWNEKSSDQMGIIVQTHPERIYPKRKIETVSVPGRNGDLVFSQDAFENYEQTYSIAVAADTFDLMETSKEVTKWLLGPKGYCKLEDSYDPTTYRMAYFVGPVNISTYFSKVGVAEITFMCKPQRYLKSSRKYEYTEVTNTLVNPTGFVALPKIRVYGNSGVVNVNGYAMSFSSISEYVDVDCELMDCYKGLLNKNSTLTLSSLGFPKLTPGDNNVSFSGEITKVIIDPRWWVL